MNNVIGTNLSLVQEKIKSTETSRAEMVASLKNLIETINNTTDWKGVDADRYKAILIDFCKKLINCANWMDAAGGQATKHAFALLERAKNTSNIARMFD